MFIPTSIELRRATNGWVISHRHHGGIEIDVATSNAAAVAAVSSLLGVDQPLQDASVDSNDDVFATFAVVAAGVAAPVLATCLDQGTSQGGGNLHAGGGDLGGCVGHGGSSPVGAATSIADAAQPVESRGEG